VHVFPEGLVHQHADTDLRYFKWGLARLILEADPAPDVLPMFIDGTQHIMPEDRTFPRFLPRVGRKVRVAFGEVVDYEEAFGDLRRRWEGLVKREREREARAGVVRGGEEEVGRGMVLLPGELPAEALRFGREAQEIRIEVARRMREEILKVRKTMGGFAEPVPSFALAETWAPDDAIAAKKYKSRVDGSNINQD
jgi:monolysocardiolipin acyltransferase